MTLGYPQQQAPTSSAVSVSSSSAAAAGPKKTVLVTGANGYLASYIVRDLLASGHTVHACVRDATNEASVRHLLELKQAPKQLKLFSTGNLQDVDKTHSFDEPMKGCDAIFHAATPVQIKFQYDEEYSGEREIYQPAMTSTQELLDCLRRNSDGTIRCLVLTSSMSAVAPRPEPPLKDESHWSDAQDQRQRENWYGTTKTSQEQLVRDWIRNAKKDGLLSPSFVYAAICPTMVIGPLLRSPQRSKAGGEQPEGDTDDGEQQPIIEVDGTMGSLQRWLRFGRSVEPLNDSMSFIHVQDCAKIHTRIIELTAPEINLHQRYMCLIESLHWNDILAMMKEMYPNLRSYQPYEGNDKVKPTQFDLTNLNSLGIPYKSTRETLQDSIQYLNQIGALD